MCIGYLGLCHIGPWFIPGSGSEVISICTMREIFISQVKLCCQLAKGNCYPSGAWNWLFQRIYLFPSPKNKLSTFPNICHHFHAFIHATKTGVCAKARWSISIHIWTMLHRHIYASRPLRVWCLLPISVPNWSWWMDSCFSQGLWAIRPCCHLLL
jgi:hypothetical protein